MHILIIGIYTVGDSALFAFSLCIYDYRLFPIEFFRLEIAIVASKPIQKTKKNTLKKKQTNEINDKKGTRKKNA